MAIRFDIKLYEQIKKSYMHYLSTGSVYNPQDLLKFETYKLYLDRDVEIKEYIKELKLIKQREKEEEKKRQEAETLAKRNATPKLKKKLNNSLEKGLSKSNKVEDKVVSTKIIGEITIIDREYKSKLQNLNRERRSLRSRRNELGEERFSELMNRLNKRIDQLTRNWEEVKHRRFIDNLGGMSKIEKNIEKRVRETKNFTFATKIIYTPMGGKNQ